MPRGGSRPGAGRKPKSELYERPIRKAEKAIVAHLDDLIAAKLRLALGVTVQEVDDETGGVEIYTKPPSGKDINDLLDRIMGKPVQRQEITGEDGGPLEIATLTDDERARRIAALLEAARSRRAGSPADAGGSDAV